MALPPRSSVGLLLLLIGLREILLTLLFGGDLDVEPSDEVFRLRLQSVGDLESLKLRCPRLGRGDNERDKLRSLPLVLENLGGDRERE